MCEISKIYGDNKIQALSAQSLHHTLGVYDYVYNNNNALLEHHSHSELNKFNKVLNNYRALQELTYKDLRYGVDKRTKMKSKGLSGTRYKGSTKGGMVIFNTKSSEYAKNNTIWVQKIIPLELIDVLLMDDLNDREKVNLAISGDLAVSCDCPAFCLKKGTKIQLLDGRSLPIEDIVKEHTQGNELWAYSINNEGNPVPNKIKKAFVSGQSKSFIKVTLDNGKVITTTPDHEYMLRDGSYSSAKSLSIGQSLMPRYSKTTKQIVNIERITIEENEDVYDLTMENEPNFLLGAGVVVHNSYWGYEYILTQVDAAEGMGEYRRPNIRNPQLKGSVCKHLYLALYALTFHMSQVTRDYKSKGVFDLSPKLLKRLQNK